MTAPEEARPRGDTGRTDGRDPGRPGFDSASGVEQVLRQRESEVLEALRLGESSAEPPPLDGATGRLTRMDALQQQQMALHGQRRLRLRLDRIRGALARLKEGTYGACARCRGPVEAGRLELEPESPFCTRCQEAIERSGRV